VRWSDVLFRLPMIAAATSLRHWRAALLVLLLLFVAMLTALAALDSDPPTDRLPLRRVPESAYTSAGIALYPTYGEEGSFGPKGAEVLAAGLVCCGEPSQTVLVRVGQVGSDHPTLAYALNYDTDKAPEDAPLGGHFLTAFTKDLDYYVAFLDAHTGDLIYHLQPGSYPPFPLEPPYKSASKQIIARNLDGPDAFVTLSTWGPDTTVVQCGEERAVLSTQPTITGLFDLSVYDASSGKLLFQRQLLAGSQRWVLSIRHDGIVVGDEAAATSVSEPRLPCR